MTFPSLSSRWFDSFSIATGSSLITGALSVVTPFLTALSVTLVVLALASWVALLRKEDSHGLGGAPSSRCAALLALALGATLFLFPAPVPPALHGPVLPVTLVPLWLVERGRPRGLASAREDS